MSVPADRVVMTSAIITISSTTAASVLPTAMGGRGELPHPRMLIGSAITFVGLSALSDYAPGLAAPLAAAIMVTALTYYGFPLLDHWFNNTHNTGKGK